MAVSRSDESDGPDWMARYDDALARGEPPPTDAVAAAGFEPQSAAFLHLLDTLRHRPPNARAEPDDPLAREGVRLGVLPDDGRPLTAYQRSRLAAGRGGELSLGRRYLIVDELGAGGMGRVLLCVHRVMRHRVAVKVLYGRHTRDPVRMERFRREARAAAALNHPHIVRAFEMDQAHGRPFLVMEYVAGQTLHDLVTTGRPLPAERAADLVRQAAAGLAHAHAAGLVHRDVKPANLMLTAGDVVKVLDLGLARFAADESDRLTRETDAAALLGTADYMAPEQARRGFAADHGADVYSLGCVFYFLLTGRAPYADRPLAEKLAAHQSGPFPDVLAVRPEVPPATADLIRRMTARRPDDRPPMAEVVRALSTSPAAAASPSPFADLADGLPTAGRPPQVGWTWAAGGLAAATATVAAGWFVLSAALRPPAVRPPEPPTGTAAAVATTPEAMTDAEFNTAAAGWPRDRLESAVRVRLAKRNPGLRTDEVRLTWRDERAEAVELPAAKTRDVGPLRALPHLRRLTVRSESNDGGLSDLSPLRGLKLQAVDLSGNPALRDVSPLAGSPLEVLHVEATAVADLPRWPTLRMLFAGRSRLTTLTSLAGLPHLEIAHIEETSVDSLEPLRHSPGLRSVQIMKTEVRSLAPLAGKPIDYLNLSNTHVEDLSALADAPLGQLTLLFGSKVRTLAPLRRCPVRKLQVEQSLIDDWDVLAGWPLEELTVGWERPPPPPLVEVIRGHQTLTVVNGLPRAEFLGKLTR